MVTLIQEEGLAVFKLFSRLSTWKRLVMILFLQSGWRFKISRLNQVKLWRLRVMEQQTPSVVKVRLFKCCQGTFLYSPPF